MGWAKYAEDNDEIITERMRDREATHSEPRVILAFTPSISSTANSAVHIQASTKESIKKSAHVILRSRD